MINSLNQPNNAFKQPINTFPPSMPQDTRTADVPRPLPGVFLTCRPIAVPIAVHGVVCYNGT